MERVVLDLCRNLDRSRYDVAVYCTHVLGPLAADLEQSGVAVHHHPIRRRLDHWTRPVRIYRFLRGFRPDVVHTQHMAAFLDAALATRLAGVGALVHTDHSKYYPTEKRRYLLAERVLSGLADAFCAVSRHTRRELAQHEGIPESRIEVVYNGFDFEALPGERDRAEIRSALGIPPDAPVLGAIARLEWQKGLDLLVAAMPRVLRQLPAARAVIVGGGSREEELRRQIEELGLGRRVHLAGWRTDATRFLAAIDLFVMSSNFEGMPIALLEAMAMSLPILATAVGGVPEMVEDDVSGRLMRDRDPHSFGRTAAEMLGDAERLRRYGRAGRQRYERDFRVASMVDSYDRIYRRCLRRDGED